MINLLLQHDVVFRFHEYRFEDLAETLVHLLLNYLSKPELNAVVCVLQVCEFFEHLLRLEQFRYIFFNFLKVSVLLRYDFLHIS